MWAHSRHVFFCPRPQPGSRLRLSLAWPSTLPVSGGSTCVERSLAVVTMTTTSYEAGRNTGHCKDASRTNTAILNGCLLPAGTWVYRWATSWWASGCCCCWPGRRRILRNTLWIRGRRCCDQCWDSAASHSFAERENVLDEECSRGNAASLRGNPKYRRLYSHLIFTTWTLFGARISPKRNIFCFSFLIGITLKTLLSHRMVAQTVQIFQQGEQEQKKHVSSLSR